MATVPSFMDWSRRRRSENLMDTAEDLLEKLEDVSDLLTEIEDKYIKDPIERDVTENEAGADDKEDAERDSTLRQFRDGLDSARNLVGVLKREKWRLNKREMSVELRMGELEDYKTHLKTDMSSLNETVDALSVRVVQLENSLCEAQEIQETLEAEVNDAKEQLEKSDKEKREILASRKSLEDELKTLKKSVGTMSRENDQLQLTVLQEENHKLKEMIRDAESKIASPAPKDSTPIPPQRHKSKAAAAAGTTLLKRPVENGDTPEVYL
ncbi:kinetochore protein SLK19-like isoform X1 [Haliotis rufescens]|uniref:kinetochore protein SLK19-like isoform X1 n=1 Tax=Haliotis rufescens TaxID=6454 RepID=UPI001EB063F3|nr:kinetochore protein SLK19-like isoform X1 [Haliotis rufescens]